MSYWLHIRLERKTVRRWDRPTPSQIVAEVAYRVCRRYKVATVGGWNDVIWKVAQRYSGNPSNTAKSLTIMCRPNRLHRPIILSAHGAEEKYPASPWMVRERLSRWESIRRNRYFRSTKTCERCGKFDPDPGKGWSGVCTRFGHACPEDFKNPAVNVSPVLCFRCWAREAPLIRRMKDCENLRRELRNFNRLIKEVRKGKERGFAT